KLGRSGKMVKAFFCCDPDMEEQLKSDTGGVGSRCICLENDEEGVCIMSGKKTKNLVYFARNY
ncbi:MAG: proline--tRNA ligase, partial [Nanoarchaeota archaeon]